MALLLEISSFNYLHFHSPFDFLFPVFIFHPPPPFHPHPVHVIDILLLTTATSAVNTQLSLNIQALSTAAVPSYLASNATASASSLKPLRVVMPFVPPTIAHIFLISLSVRSGCENNGIFRTYGSRSRFRCPFVK